MLGQRMGNLQARRDLAAEIIIRDQEADGPALGPQLAAGDLRSLGAVGVKRARLAVAQLMGQAAPLQADG